MEIAMSTILPLAIGVAINPVSIITVIFLLFSPRARLTGPVFVLGWLLGLILVGGITLLIASAQDLPAGGPSSSVASVIKLVLGLLFLFLAFTQWRKRPKPGVEAKLPRWMEALDAFTPLKALGLGVVLSAGNIKVVPLTISAGLEIASASLSVGQAIGLLVLFVALASLTVIAPVFFYLVRGTRATQMLQRWKAWLTTHNAAVLAGVFLVLGVLLVIRGVGELTA